jgi:hypothetical protein
MIVGNTPRFVAYVVLLSGELRYQPWCNACEQKIGDTLWSKQEHALDYADYVHVCSLDKAPQWLQETQAPDVVYLTTIEDVQALSAGSVVELIGGRYAEIAEELEYFPVGPDRVRVYFFGQRDSWPIDKNDLPAKLVK